MIYKKKLLYETLDRLERGLYTGLSISWCTDSIVWLWKFRHITHDELVELTEKATCILNNVK